MTDNKGKNKEFLSTVEAAEVLGVSRVTVFNRIKRGEIKAFKIGREFAIPQIEIRRLLGGELTDEEKQILNKAVDKTFNEYGEALRLLNERDELSLESKMEELRNILNSSITYKQKAWDERGSGNWNKLWSALDNLEDAQLAINELENSDQGLLAVYGVLQAFVVQQDAIRYMAEAIGIAPAKPNDYPRLKKIRNIRHEVAGHPSKTEMGTNSSYEDGTETYTSLGARKYQNHILEYVVWSKNGTERKEIDLLQAAKDQEDLLIVEIDRMLSKISSDDAEHKEKFEKSSLQKMLHTTTYLARKAYSTEQDPEYSRISIKSLANMYEDFKKEICSRYQVNSLDETVHIPGLLGEVEKVDKTLQRVQDMLADKNNTDDLDLDVYVESLERSFKSLKDMAREIDEEFKVDKCDK